MGHTDHSVASMCLALCWCAEVVVVVVLGQTCSLQAPVPTSLPSAMLLWHCHPHHMWLSLVKYGDCSGFICCR